MNNNILKPSSRTRHAAAVLCAVLAGLGLARGAAAQEPQPKSPAVPTPYQSPLFHAGGSDPVLALTTPYGLVDPALMNPLFGQLQGTPTGLVASGGSFYPVQIPSFELGAYDPALGPGVTPAGTYYPSHLADGSVYSWEAPFNYIPLTVGMVLQDDSFPATTAPAAGTSGFVLTGGNWTQQTTGPAAGTATGGEYDRLPPGQNGAATWTLVATAAGSYSVYFHIPDQIEDSNGLVEPRSTQVTYQIATTGLNTVTSTATVSQTEANSSQFLAGPFLLAVGDTVTVTLQRDATHNQNTEVVTPPATTGDYLIADSMTLQTAIGDVRSTPTAINYTSYPNDFARVKYWGIYVTPSTAATGGVNAPIVAGTNLTTNALPDYGLNSFPPVGPPLAGARPYIRYGKPTAVQPDGTTVDPIHRIRQLVYFGRQDPTFSQGDTVDDSNTTQFSRGQFGTLITDGTATNNEYRATAGLSAGGTSARWTLVAPNGGSYYATVHLPETQGSQKRISDATYTVTSPNGTQIVTISQAQTGDVTLPTGAIVLNAGQTVTVTLAPDTHLTPSNSYTIVADSVRITTGDNGTGAIYCVDGFTGGVVWRFQTPGGLNGPSAPVFSSPVVTKINVLVTPAGPGGVPAAVYQNKLVVIVGDDNGMVYCLDAIGNGDGTSNANAIDPTSGLPIYIPQPGYGTTPPTQVDAAGYTPHVGTTGAYWVYRPDPNQPKYVTGTNIGKVKPQSQFDVNSDLPVPAAFSTASPNVFVDSTVSTTVDATGSIPLNPDGSAPSNSKIYIGNSNGVLYALDGAGVAIDGTSQATYAASGDRFNASYDLRSAPTVFPAVTTDAIIPTPQPLWWFTLRGADPNSTNNPSSADIESAPAIYLTPTATTVTGPPPVTTYTYAPTVYIGSAHEVESTSNVGRLYALSGTYGPSGDNGLSLPATQPDPTKPNYTGPGSDNYNVGQHPQISATDTADWSFPDAYDRATSNATKNNQGQSSNKLPRPALGNVTGSPVVFTDTNETDVTRRTRIYFAANVGLEVPTGSTVGTAASARPDDTQTGRIWAVNLDGSVGRTTNSTSTAGSTVWSYPLANDPNNAALDTTAEPTAPLGSFLHGTPAMGFVQFPGTITGYPALPSDHIHGSLLGQSIPMLYIATRGVNDTALYAVDVDGDTDAQRLVYRQVSPDGSIFQSSPALVVNTSSIAGTGNGGAVYVVSDNTLYDFSATPISNPGILDPATGVVDYPLVRENRAYTGFGPISSPTVSAADTTDLLTALELTAYEQANPTYTTTVTDWIYVGDSSTGFCRGITPYDTTDLGIPGELGSIVPPSAEPPGTVDLQAIMQVYLVNAGPDSGSTSAAVPPALPVGPKAPLPVYDWGQDVYIRFKNVAPPPDPSGNANNDKHVVDSNVVFPASVPVEAYGRGGPIEFDLSDTTITPPPAGGTGVTTVTPADHGTVPAVFLPGVTTPLGNGFIARSEATPSPNINLIDPTTNKGYIGAYTYAISDGTARRNTPGSRRQVTNAKQTVEVYTTLDGANFTDTGRTAVLAVQTTSGNLISTQITKPDGTTGYASNFTQVQPVDEPTFGILNPLAVRAGGIPLALNPGTTPTNAVDVGDIVGPFRGVKSPISNSPIDLEALANGNDIPLVAPSSTSSGGSPILRPLDSTNPATTPHIVVTSTGLISHNTSGDNSDAAPLKATTLPGTLPTGVYNTNTDEGLIPPPGYTFLTFGSQSAPFSLDLTDRSALGPREKHLRVKTGTISGGGAGLYWNDNSIPAAGQDHDSVVNFLPWETAPVGYKIGSNPSTDYPDIASSDISATLYPWTGGTADLTLGNGIAQPATLKPNANDPVTGREVYINPVQFHVSIPHFQPANQQMYRQNSSGGYIAGPPTGSTSGGEITPSDEVGGSSSDILFPMGYVTTRRIYIPDQNGFYRPGAAYRDVRIYTGVPPDYSTQMGDATAEVGRVPSGFGVQTSSFAGLTDASGINTFDPYNLDFQNYFQPLKIYNTGNVNLLNVHLDQKQQYTVNGTTDPATSLSLFSDAIDSLSSLPGSLASIPGYDYAGALTGPRIPTYPTANGKNVPEDFFLIRSSLDGDLVSAYGHNPFIQNTGLLNVYPGATFHKAQVGSGQPSTLFVPDSPEGFTQGASLDVPPTNNPTHTKDTNNNSLPFKTAPFVSVAVPFGTPVGSYSANLQLFEGLDAGGYSSVVTNSPGGSGTYTGLTAQIFPPQYGSAIGGIGTPTTDTYGRMLDTIQILQSTGNPSLSLMPNSSNGTALNVKVIEDRMTDGATFGGVPMIDQGPAVPATGTAAAQSVPDFAPAAFRDPVTGNLSVYWTSGRSASGFGIYSATVPMLNGAFMPVDPSSPGTATAPNYVNEWWTSLGSASAGYNAGALVPAIPTNQGTNSGLSIVQDPTDLTTLRTVGAFVVNVQAPPLTASYQNTLLYYPVTPKNGALGAAKPVTNDPTQVKYGVKGLFTNTAFSNSTPNLWAFWTATTRGRSAIYYNSQDPTSKGWIPATGTTIGLLPIPAGLTAVADAAPLLMFGNVPGATGSQPQATIEVTYSGTAPDGNVDLYQSRYQPDATKAAVLDLVPFPAVTEILTATGQTGGWYQARDVAWSRTSQLNLLVGGTAILYDATSKPLFSRAVFDKASGLLVITGVPSTPNGTTLFNLPAGAPTSTTVTVYIDLATGRARFSLTPSGTVTAFFSPLARRLTADSRADTGPTTFLDGNYKANDAPTLNNVKADRRWYIWRKSGAGGAAPSATIYYKTQRLTAYLPKAVDVTKAFTFSLNGTAYSNPVDIHNVPAVLNTDGSIKYSASARVFFPISSGAEGATITGSYTATDGSSVSVGPDTVQWQDETRANDTALSPTDAIAGLAAVNQGYAVPLDTTVNENNITSFLDTAAYSNTASSVIYPHKVWLFWNSTRNGTADLYYETINPLFAAQLPPP